MLFNQSVAIKDVNAFVVNSYEKVTSNAKLHLLAVLDFNILVVPQLIVEDMV